MGLFDSFNPEFLTTPAGQGLLGTFEAASTPRAVGSPGAMTVGMGLYNEAKKREDLKKLQELQMQMHQMELAKAKRQEEEAKRASELDLSKFVKTPTDQLLATDPNNPLRFSEANAANLKGLTTQVDRPGMYSAMMGSKVPLLVLQGMTGYAQMDEKEMERELRKQMQTEKITENNKAAAERLSERLAAEERMNRMTNDTKSMLATMSNDTRQLLLGQKPKLPANAIKLQNEELDALSIANSLDADVGAMRKNIDSGKLKLGLMENAESIVRNKLGKSTENSVNYASFISSIEKMRNDSLRLNKGTQTEGDAVRAWNEIFENPNDEKVVAQRLKEIQNYNKRAANYRKMNIDMIRSNFNADPMDYSKYDNPGAALVTGGATSDFEMPPAGAVRLKKKGP